MVARSKPYHLLIADDDAAFREVLCEILGPYVDLMEAASGEEAIEIVEHTRVDILLLDMHMDVLTGLETLQIVKAKLIIEPCILITADVTDELIRDAGEAEAFSVLSKPVRKSELVDTVSTALADAYSDPNALALNN
ncbi:MAG: response regulator [Planctomycetaceae bacterium]|nr:response regulator [Planctomycetaceae bacterium]